MEPDLAKNSGLSEKKYIKYLGGLLVAILVILGVGYFIYENIIFTTSPEQGINLSPAPAFYKGQPAVEKPFDFKGTLYLSLREIDGTFGLGIYAFNINGVTDSRFTKIFADKKLKDKSYNIYISPSVSEDGQKLVFAKGKADGSGLQIFTSEVGGWNLQQITSTPDKYKREPVFSPSGKFVAYISHNTKSSANDPDPSIPESWSTYLTDLKGKVVKVANGVNPIFSPDEKKLLILQIDGLHAFDIKEWSKPVSLGLVVKTVGGPASTAMKIGVSADGKMMAWPSVGKNNVIVSQINSWNDFSFSPFLVIKTKAFWSVFSPDKKYLAVVEWRRDDTGAEYPIIMGYDLSNGMSEKIVTLTNDDKSYLWFGSWK